MKNWINAEVKANPWRYVFIALAVGVAIGLVIANL